MRRPYQITPPDGELMPVDDALREHLRIGSAVGNDLVQTYIQAAIDLLDGYSGQLGRCILKQEWAFPVPLDSNEMLLPFPDCREMSIEQRNGIEFTAIAGTSIVPGFDRVTLCGITGDRAEIWLLATAGWETPDDAPESLKQAIRLLVAHWSEHPEAVALGTTSTEVSLGVRTLLRPLRNGGLVG
jgi:hypothetical protein